MSKCKYIMAIGMAMLSSSLFASDNPLTGKWIFHKLASGEMSPKNIEEVWTFSDKEITIIERVSGAKLAKHKYFFDTSKVPHQLTQHVSNVLTNFEEKKRLSIFKIVGDELHIATMGVGKTRPTKFTKENTGIYKLVNNKQK